MKVYFATDHEGNFEYCESEKKAFKAAERALKRCIDEADDSGAEEPEGIENICYGSVLGLVIAVDEDGEEGYVLADPEELQDEDEDEDDEEQDESVIVTDELN